jgi:hypothetical protein
MARLSTVSSFFLSQIGVREFKSTNVVHFEIKSTHVAVVVSENCFCFVNVLLLKHNFFTWNRELDLWRKLYESYAKKNVEVGKDIFNMYLKARTRIKFLKET